MNYLSYVIAAYAVFVLALGWDFLSARLQLRRALKTARARAHRATPPSPPPADAELQR